MVRRMINDKAPGPYDFSLGFLKFCWDVVVEYLMKVFQELFLVGKFEKSLNATFIALLTKKIRASKVNYFRLISIVNGVYKIISKVLANRLGEVLGWIITKPE